MHPAARSCLLDAAESRLRGALSKCSMLAFCMRNAVLCMLCCAALRCVPQLLEADHEETLKEREEERKQQAEKEESHGKRLAALQEVSMRAGRLRRVSAGVAHWELHGQRMCQHRARAGDGVLQLGPCCCAVSFGLQELERSERRVRELEGELAAVRQRPAARLHASADAGEPLRSGSCEALGGRGDGGE